MITSVLTMMPMIAKRRRASSAQVDRQIVVAAQAIAAGMSHGAAIKKARMARQTFYDRLKIATQTRTIEVGE